MADQLVEIVDYDPVWPERFAGQRTAVEAALRPWLAGDVEHIGSTSVPGLRAKPIVDMLAPVRSLAAADGIVGALSSEGWLYWPDDPCGHYRRWFLRPDPAARTHHLHVIEHGHPQALALLAFRDALRADAALRARYGELKAGLAARHRASRNAYTNAKLDFVEQVLRDAGVVPPPAEHLPE